MDGDGDALRDVVRETVADLVVVGDVVGVPDRVGVVDGVRVTDALLELVGELVDDVLSCAETDRVPVNVAVALPVGELDTVVLSLPVVVELWVTE